ncbi:general stress protein [Nonomuraea pusilla]|uniref:General stress protein 17M-like domain-containing protein n=1 Tax=Nonomuraea pusilla TaxID=46177 RepID=A0A1H7UMH3_9ACTN|nr:general stress protein [Nonomuraea pusilla]SEL97828.1 hypothetical protein SAMN05660976_03865 [Nonomuraea pusilla]
MLPISSPADVEHRAVVGSYPTYEQARGAVRFLADHSFPIERTSIVGTGLRLVETVLGPFSRRRAVAGGAATGALFGAVASLLFGVFAGSAALAVAGLLYGAILGAVFGLTVSAASPGRRDFLSREALVADRYEVYADHAVAEQARNLLITYGWRTG